MGIFKPFIRTNKKKITKIDFSVTQIYRETGNWAKIKLPLRAEPNSDQKKRDDQSHPALLPPVCQHFRKHIRSCWVSLIKFKLSLSFIPPAEHTTVPHIQPPHPLWEAVPTPNLLLARPRASAAPGGWGGGAQRPPPHQKPHKLHWSDPSQLHAGRWSKTHINFLNMTAFLWSNSQQKCLMLLNRRLLQTSPPSPFSLRLTENNISSSFCSLLVRFWNVAGWV